MARALQQYYNTKQAARYCLVKVASIYTAVQKGRLKREPDGTISKAELDKFLANRTPPNHNSAQALANKGLAGGAAPSSDNKLARATLRFKKYKALEAKIKVQVVRKALLSKDEIMQGWKDRVVAVRSGLLTLPSRLSMVLVNKDSREIYALIEDEVIRLLNAFAREGKYTPKDVGEDGDNDN